MLLDNADVKRLDSHDWRKQEFEHFEKDMTSESPRFPCIFGSMGLSRNELRFSFFDDVDDHSIEELGKALREYVEQARSFGNYTSMVTFFNIGKDLSIHEYQHMFWSILTRLHTIDLKEWPEFIPNEENDPLWEFCFHGEPIFVVCNTPAHEVRRSRRANTYMITFQPRWVFDSIGLGTPKGDKSKDLVRSLLRQYDAIEPFPHLGIYGNPNNREWLQYFIPDTNEVSATAQCPFHHMRRNTMSSVQYIKGSDVTLEEAVMQLLPVTGSVEVQRDTPFREHKSHTHPTDETLLIINGDITFFTEEGELHCTPGDRILLPANTVHSSKAGENGTLYIIALEFVEQPKEEVLA
ncbi:YqcI/YcgG family protein [Paenibacillus sp. 1781tsa1]|uniref:YqcI/YcgG family protein n=1 Tax=Paenibacillus sp. 1781tsa1 TaxID=2953810 RepID=UPI0020A08D0A|nr:YqcI/YcgG family protein [Paenibacillus sp. 1781tsa1]MCP1181952.1 YqcI/YcgG family protein [Paenibacillus sp. 1781tsa1]